MPNECKLEAKGQETQVRSPATSENEHSAINVKREGNGPKAI